MDAVAALPPPLIFPGSDWLRRFRKLFFDGQFMPKQAAQFIEQHTRFRRSVQITWLNTPSAVGGNQASYTFVGAIPSKSYAYKCVVALTFGSASGVKSITTTGSSMAGVGISIAVQHAINNSNNSGIIVADIPASTSGDLVIAFTGGNAERCAPVVYEMRFAGSSTPSTTLTDATTDPSGGNINIPAGGCLVAVGATSGSTTGTTWTGATEDVDQSVEASRRCSTASASGMAAETNRSVTADWTGGTPATSSFCAATFAP